jgi:hypothetical protein
MFICLENLLILNDMINNVVAKFADIQKGIYDSQYDISGKPPKQTSSEEPRQAISLIDLDDDASTSANTPSASSGSALNELSDLFGQTSISTTPSAARTSSTNNSSAALFDLLDGSSTHNAPPAYSFEATTTTTNNATTQSVSPALSNASLDVFSSPVQHHQGSNTVPSPSTSSSPTSSDNGSLPKTHPTSKFSAADTC